MKPTTTHGNKRENAEKKHTVAEISVAVLDKLVRKHMTEDNKGKDKKTNPKIELQHES